MFSLLHFAFVQEAVFVRFSLSAVVVIVIAAAMTSVVDMVEQLQLRSDLASLAFVPFSR